MQQLAQKNNRGHAYPLSTYSAQPDSRESCGIENGHLEAKIPGGRSILRIVYNAMLNRDAA